MARSPDRNSPAVRTSPGMAVSPISLPAMWTNPGGRARATRYAGGGGADDGSRRAGQRARPILVVEAEVGRRLRDGRHRARNAPSETIVPLVSHEHVDVLIVGAGISGVGAGYHLQANCPGKSFAILEARDAIGGTWDLFRYPGIRSDSDMLTLGYSFRPWTDAKAIADGPSILDYVNETAREYGIDRQIRFGHKVVGAEWSSADARWTVDIERPATGERLQMTCNFLHSCCGYYSYDGGYTPDFAGTERFAGESRPPAAVAGGPRLRRQARRRDRQRGDGGDARSRDGRAREPRDDAPALAELRGLAAWRSTRSPSALRRFLPPKLAYSVLRWKNVLMTMLVFQLSRRRPEFIKRLIRRGVERQLPAGYDIDTHFKPTYNPWDQRMCLVPDGDLFAAISNGSASVVTDRIETFTERGLALESGAELEADVVVTATGLNLVPLGGIDARRRRRAGRAPRDHGLQGDDAQRGAEHGGLPRLHERLLDAEVRPHLRVRVPAAQPHGSRRLRLLHAAGSRSLGHSESRSSTSAPATCSARSSSSRSRARGAPGACTRTTRATSSRCATARSRTRRWSSRAPAAAVSHTRLSVEWPISPSTAPPFAGYQAEIFLLGMGGTAARAPGLDRRARAPGRRSGSRIRGRPPTSSAAPGARRRCARTSRRSGAGGSCRGCCATSPSATSR